MQNALRFCANISMLFTGVPFADRIAAAAKAGFLAVECQFPYEVSARDLRKRLDETGLVMTGLNAPPGGLGEFGFAALPAKRAAFRESLAKALDYAHELDTKNVHCLSGVLNGVPLADARA
jgi:hydroxypyruvate isomerase